MCSFDSIIHSVEHSNMYWREFLPSVLSGLGLLMGGKTSLSPPAMVVVDKVVWTILDWTRFKPVPVSGFLKQSIALINQTHNTNRINTKIVFISHTTHSVLQLSYSISFSYSRYFRRFYSSVCRLRCDDLVFVAIKINLP